MSQKRRYEQQDYESYIYNVRETLDYTVINTKYNRSKQQRRQYPDNLHAATAAKVQQLGSFFKIIAGTAYAHPAHSQQCHKKEQCEPVKATQDALAFSIEIILCHLGLI